MSSLAYAHANNRICVAYLSLTVQHLEDESRDDLVPDFTDNELCGVSGKSKDGVGQLHYIRKLDEFIHCGYFGRTGYGV